MGPQEFREELIEFVADICRREFASLKAEQKDELSSYVENINFKIQELESDVKTLSQRIENLNRYFDEHTSRLERVDNNSSHKADSIRDELNTRMEGMERKIDTVKDNLDTKIENSSYKTEMLKEDFGSKNESLRDELRESIASIREEVKADVERMNDKIEDLSYRVEEMSRDVKTSDRKVGGVEDQLYSVKQNQEVIQDLVDRIKEIEDKIHR